MLVVRNQQDNVVSFLPHVGTIEMKAALARCWPSAKQQVDFNFSGFTEWIFVVSEVLRRK